MANSGSFLLMENICVTEVHFMKNCSLSEVFATYRSDPLCNNQFERDSY